MMKNKNPLNERQMNDLDFAMRTFRDTLSLFSLPIYKHKKKGPPDSIGTGFVIDYFGSCYFVTAAHVMDHHDNDEPLFYFFSKSKRQYIEGPYRISSDNMSERKNDKVDLIVIKLPDGKGRPEASINRRAILPHMITLDTTKLDDCRFIVIGYPVTKQKADYKNKRLNTNCYAWIGKSISDEIYSKLNIEKSQNLLIQFERKNILRTDNIVGSTFPAPQGISGAPVWHTIGYRNEEKILVVDDIKLAGVLIEHIPQKKMLLATSINIVLDMIVDLHNDSLGMK